MSLFRKLYDTAVARVAALKPGDPNVAVLTRCSPTPRPFSGITKAFRSSRVEFRSEYLHLSVDYELPRSTWLKGTRVGVTGTWNDKYNIANSGGVVYVGGAQLRSALMRFTNGSCSSTTSTFASECATSSIWKTTSCGKPASISSIPPAGPTTRTNSSHRSRSNSMPRSGFERRAPMDLAIHAAESVPQQTPCLRR